MASNLKFNSMFKVLMEGEDLAMSSMDVLLYEMKLNEHSLVEWLEFMKQWIHMINCLHGGPNDDIIVNWALKEHSWDITCCIRWMS